MTTEHDLKEHFLATAKDIIDEYVNAALGKGDLNSNNTTCREEVWELAKKLILQSSDKIKIKTNDIQGVLDAVSNGECTLKEGKQLIEMYKTMQPEDKSKVTVNVLGHVPRLGAE